MPRKCLDITRLANAGFRYKISLEAGILRTIEEYRQRKAEGRIASI
jgi:nucleoside-diphosphate-sugar epimerase